ncbi:hypothetical protein [Variovorax sp. HW608]|uniref:hypothetical protein n=1 Tax=Variovorax sp. HW608 TaxID=1034889 RepID=UPI0012FD657D|nr:hypothetical protein [Variovorax sp. HW608]
MTTPPPRRHLFGMRLSEAASIDVAGDTPEHEQDLIELAELALAGLQEVEAGLILDEAELDAELGIHPAPKK